ncbi:hypothetical protein [Nocardia sp. XZ_19_231]|uniref:hypothetical protein n=1 Tax=Nocardia sp. XZ_19_231 TaxID=2769252 RepID=UPI00188F9EF6|nr:hypothetical protein [Nocardia sp. XZ_19_231]
MRGIPIPAAGKAALGELACGLSRPATATASAQSRHAHSRSHARGVSIELIDPATLFESGLTGVETVDRWLASVNPGLRRAPSRVYSPDAPRTARLR